MDLKNYFMQDLSQIILNYLHLTLEDKQIKIIYVR